MGRHDLAVLDHLRHHVAVRAAALHVRTQQVARAQVDDAELLHQPRALRQAASDALINGTKGVSARWDADWTVYGYGQVRNNARASRESSLSSGCNLRAV